MRRIASVLFTVLFAATMLSSVVRAQEDDDVQEIDGKRYKIQYKKKEVIDFEDVLIQGELKKPQGAYLLNRKKSDFSDMIEERAHFKRELINSLDKI